MKRDQAPNILKRARERGMTMLEMMVALLISVLVIFGVINIYRYANNSWTDGMMVEKLQHDTQNTMSWLERDVKQAVVTTDQAPMMTTDNGIPGDDGYGVIIITSDQAGLHQVNYQFTSSQNGLLQLQRSEMPYSGTIGSPDPASWTTLLTGVSTFSAAPFSVLTTYDDPVTGVTTLPHPSLSIATLSVQVPNAVRTTTQSGAIVQFNTTLTMRGNGQLQDQALEGQ